MFLRALFIGGAIAASGTDLSKIDRTIGKEPSYKHKPGYCLLVFGPTARTRVWLVQDGETIYVDRNANGDLTERGEAFNPGKARVISASYRDAEYDVGTLAPQDKTGPHTAFKITGYSENSRTWNYVLKIKVDGEIEQFAGWKPIFKDSAQKALVFHFGGPLGVQPLRSHQLSVKETKPELHIRFATPGQGEFSTVSLGYEAIPQNIEPIASILWPGSKVPTTVRLVSRC